MFIELKNLLEVDTPFGRGAVFLIESKDNDYYYTVILYEGGEFMTLSQHKCRAARNYSLGWAFKDAEMQDILDRTRKKTS